MYKAVDHRGWTSVVYYIYRRGHENWVSHYNSRIIIDNNIRRIYRFSQQFLIIIIILWDFCKWSSNNFSTKCQMYKIVILIRRTPVRYTRKRKSIHCYCVFIYYILFLELKCSILRKVILLTVCPKIPFFQKNVPIVYLKLKMYTYPI